jgi:hypothetical protein
VRRMKEKRSKLDMDRRKEDVCTRIKKSDTFVPL